MIKFPFVKHLRGPAPRGGALILAVAASAVLMLLGTAFAVLIGNEARQAQRMTAYDQALYVAESGIEDLFYQRAKDQSDSCFPFTDDGALTGAPGAMVNGNAATCDTDPSTDADPSDPDKDDIPCWPFNEKYYANVITFGPKFYCHDGSDPVECPVYAPLAVWPATPSGAPGWKDMDPGRPVPLASNAQSSGQRYSTALFTVCNDDSLGDDPATWSCLSPPCNRRVQRLSLVSVGEVVTRPGESVTRAVKVDVVDPTLYSGVIDKYVDLSMTFNTSIKGPIHINGWWNANRDEYAAILGGTYSLAPMLMSFFDTPDMVSVSFPEPEGGDLQPFLPINAPINWVHLPVRLEIPQVNWKQFEGRMDELYSEILGFYNSGSVELLKMENYDPANMYVTQGAGADEFPCASSPQGDGNAGHDDASAQDCRDMEFPDFCESGSNLTQTCCTRNSGPGRIHNCRRDGYQTWSEVAFDLFDYNSGTFVTGPEPSALGGGVGPRDRSLRYVTQRIFDLHFSGGGCGFSNPFACLTRDINRPQFVFMGRHEFDGRVFIDGAMGIGSRTPYHTCGPGDGPLDFWCAEFGPWTAFGMSIHFAFGVPHWHLGEARITGELLAHGRLFMADYVRIDGGAIYADDNVIKDETSGMDMELSMSMLLCYVFGGFAVSPFCEFLFAGTWNGIPMWPGLDFLIQNLGLPWWPYINLTNNGAVDFKAYLDIDGWNTAGFKNSGVLYTRGDVWVTEPPGIDATNMMLNLVLGGFAPFVSIVPSLDPVRIWNGGAIIAGGRELSPGVFDHGNVYIGEGRRLDLLTFSPVTNQPDMGFVFARGALQVHGDIVNRELGLVDTCAAVGIFPTEDCAARGIFYSGGVTASAHPDADTKMFTKTGGRLEWNGGFREYKVDCLNEDEPDYMDDPAGNIMCWASCLFGGCDRSEFNIQGYIFAGQAGGMPNVWFQLIQDSSVKHAAVSRRYFRSFVGTPVDWMEVDPPTNLNRL